MREEEVMFYSEGTNMSGILRLPDEQQQSYPVIVQGPGWLGLKDSKAYARFHEVFTQAGFAVFVLDYRGFGGSGGTKDFINPFWQIEDIRNAISYLETREDIDRTRIGIYGSGGTGGGNAIYVGSMDDRVKTVVANVGIGNGFEWLRSMRREYEWIAFLERLANDDLQWAKTGEGERVSPNGDIMVPTPERKTTHYKRDVDDRIPNKVYLRSARHLLNYRPEDVVHKISPRPSYLFVSRTTRLHQPINLGICFTKQAALRD
ncbi:peptidase S15 [Oceanobacillus sp. 143]|nr:peptidase S15 [Oceanobacillus sp. 143]